MTEHERREDLKVEYEAEFEPESDALATIKPEEVMALLGPSARTQMARVTLEFRRKVRSLEQEVSEMLEREVALKTQNRVLQEQNMRLGAERDEWRSRVDPEGAITDLRERLAKAEARATGGEKLVREHMARIEQLKARRPWWRFW